MKPLSIPMTKFRKKNVNNNSTSNNNYYAASGDNTDNNVDGNKIVASTPIPSDSNADDAPPGRNNKNNVIRLYYVFLNENNQRQNRVSYHGTKLHMNHWVPFHQRIWITISKTTLIAIQMEVYYVF